MNEINKNALRIIKFLIRIQQILPKVYMKQVKVYQKQLELIRIENDEWGEIIQILTLHKYLREVGNKEYVDYMMSVFKAIILEPLRKEVDEGKVKKEDVEKILITAGESFGIDTNELDKKSEDEISIYEMFTPEERKVLKTDNLKEKIAKSDTVNRFEVLKDLISLKRKLEQGFDIENLGKNNLIYKENEYKLHIGNREINIKPTRRTPKHHQLLQYLFEEELGEEYSFSAILKSRFMQDTNEVHEEKQIKYHAQGLNKKIANQTKGDNQIKKFILITENHLQINPDYLYES